MTDAAAIPEPYKWDESFDVKVDSINDQHKKLFELIDALAKDQGNADILNELLDTVKKHFQWEEDLFAKHGFENAAAHKATHDKFLADCGAVTAINDDVIQFLKKWLVTHIKGSDMKYVAPLTAAGAQ